MFSRVKIRLSKTSKTVSYLHGIMFVNEHVLANRIVTRMLHFDENYPEAYSNHD